ncbi:hypothetical protein [Bisbaumannia pacifica]|uniref:Uncharacterized protein n=1 Tax=Bisbaumannia pacifica TaxID=77098 RepID=A0A510XCZ0_9GAMM|nr:hypothetical protein [Halomonas pacifica]MBH8578767.1 hypothetical protein [Halomonas pacifica]GEK49278.1 hypothetical protein HPA02_35610 [Halomonas pacifica]
MLSRESLKRVVDRLSPEAREKAAHEARLRHMRVEDLVLEKCLSDVQGQLYALRRRKPELQVVRGGRA